MGYIFLKTDAFHNAVNSAAAKKKMWDRGGDLANYSAVRRPYRGIQIKEDTYSTIAVRRPDGNPVYLTSSSEVANVQGKIGSKGSVSEYADYILQSVQEQRIEKQQVIETFGDPYVYFFGERPRIVQFSGQLISTEDFNWRSQFWKNYDENIRGTKLVQKNARAYVSFDTIVVEGYVLNASALDNAENPYLIQFSFSMLVTNYYDWSTIGSTMFPNSKSTTDARTLNLELQTERSKFVSTGAAVRLKNLQAKGRSGIFAALRSGIRAVNNAMSMASSFIGRVTNVLGGRVVRLPLGIAGYLRNTGAAVIAGGQMEFPAMFDPVTGRYQSFNGSLKLKMPGAATFAPPWISRVTDGYRGYIFENIDEYPVRTQPDTLQDILSKKQYMAVNVNYMVRQDKMSQENEMLARYNTMAEAGGILGDVDEAVNFVKSNFGMVMSAAAFVRDPTTFLKQAVRLGGMTSKASLLNQKRQKILKKEGVAKWIGERAVETFTSLADGYTTQGEGAIPASLGEVYDQNTYQASNNPAVLKPGDKDYEAAYGSNDYTSTTEDPSLKSTIDEVYGDRDTVTSTQARSPEEIAAAKTGEVPDITPETLNAVYGTGEASKYVRTLEEIAAALQAAQNGTATNDEDTSGIRGEEDVDTEIEPIV